MAVKSMNDSYVFGMMNKGGVINTNILKSITDGAVLDLEKDLPEAYVSITRNFKMAMKLKVLELLKQGKIVLKFSPKDVKIPTSVPFILYKDSRGDIKAIVFTDIYTTQLSDGRYKTDPAKLYTMMEGGAIALAYMNSNRPMTSHANIITCGADIYSSIMLRVLNKKYSLIDKSKINSVLFLASKFFLLNVLGLDDSEQVNNYAKKNLKNANMIIIDNINASMNKEDYKDISTFITAIGDQERNNLGIKGITVRGFIESFVSMYDGSMILSLELFPYFMYNISSVLNSAYVNNQYILEDMIVETGSGAKLYNTIKDYI